jgi:hypothetical protein
VAVVLAGGGTELRPDPEGEARGGAHAKLAEVLIHRHEHAAFCCGPFQELSIAGVAPTLPGLDHVMPLIPQPVGEAPPGTPVNFAHRTRWADFLEAYLGDRR